MQENNHHRKMHNRVPQWKSGQVQNGQDLSI